jgi:hypothetical protein
MQRQFQPGDRVAVTLTGHYAPFPGTVAVWWPDTNNGYVQLDDGDLWAVGGPVVRALQVTSQGAEIPVPTREEFAAGLQRATRPRHPE